MRKEKRKYTFKRWFEHWCAFNLTSLKLNVWNIKHLFHDIDKPFLNIFISNDKVKNKHRNNSKHHIENKKKKYNYIDMIIDWECSCLTKSDATLNAYQTLNIIYNNIDNNIKNNIIFNLKKLKLC